MKKFSFLPRGVVFDDDQDSQDYENAVNDLDDR